MSDDLWPNYDEALVLDAVDRFLEREVRPNVHELEATDTWPAEIVEKMRELGLFGATIGEEFGGLGLSASTYAKIVERVSAVWMSVSGIFNSHLIMAAAVERFGSEAQKAHYLPPFASGELRGGIALTEPHCGPDLQAIRTTARRDVDRYRVNGTKTWISNGIQGHIIAVPVKTDPKAEPRHRGMSLLLIEKGEGFRVGRKLEKLGYKGIDSGELVFDECEVPCENLVGEREGRGLQQILAGLELGRINVAARGVGIARACLEESIAYSQVRKTFGKPICEHQSNPDQARGDGDRPGGVPPAHRAGRPRLRTRRALRPRSGHGQALRDRDRALQQPRGDAPPRRLRLLQRVSTSSATTATPRCSRSARAPTNFSASSSPGN